MAVDAKYIRTIAPAGGVVNFVAITGDSHRYLWANTSVIKLMLERGIRVFEKLEEADENGNTEIELTLENYTADNDGKEFDEASGDIVVKNLEEERATELKEAQEEFLEEMGLKIAEELEEKVAKLNAKEAANNQQQGSGSSSSVSSGDSLSGGGISSFIGTGAPITGGIPDPPDIP